MANRLQKRWVFTWNDSDAGLPSLQALESFLNRNAAEAVFQLEAGEETNRQHYQGRLNLLGPRVGKKALLSLFSELWDIKNLTLEPEIAYDSTSYCTKSETRIAGPVYCGLASYRAEKQPESLDLRLWQRQLLAMLTQGASQARLRDRKVLWLQDKLGRTGKSRFIKHLAMNSQKLGIVCKKIPIDRPDRIRAALTKLSKKANVDLYMFDFTRTQGEDTSFKDLFEVIEEIKNGYIVDTMYGNYSQTFLHPAMVAIFTNEDILGFDKFLSQDRWEAFVLSPGRDLTDKDKTSLCHIDIEDRKSVV